MKRSFLALLMVLIATTTADAATTKKKARKHSKKAPVEQTLTTEGQPIPATNIPKERKQSDSGSIVGKPGPIPFGKPVESQLKRAGSRRFDLRSLPQTRPPQRERVELEPPDHTPVAIEGIAPAPEPSHPAVPLPLAPAPAPNAVYEGLDRVNWGAGSPPDTNGDAGPTYYIQNVNTSIGVFGLTPPSPPRPR